MSLLSSDLFRNVTQSITLESKYNSKYKNFTLDIKAKHIFANIIVLKSETYSILKPSLPSRNWTTSKVYLLSNPLKHTYFKIKITFFGVWHNKNLSIFFEVLESQVSS